jgi:hypothetical protein
MYQQPGKKKSGRVKWGIGVAIAIVVIFGAISSAAGHKSGGSNDKATPDSGTTSPTSVLSDPPLVAAPTHKKPPTTTTVLSTSGTGIKNTQQFTVGDSWTLHYAYDCTKTMGAIGGKGNFIVSDESGMPMVNELGAKGSASSPQYSSGTHHLEVNSECAWTLRVTTTH